VIVPRANPFLPSSKFKFSHILLRFSFEELLGSRSEDLVIHIDNIKNSIKKIQLKNAQLFKNISNLEAEKLKLTEEKSQNEALNSVLLNEFSAIRQKIVKLYKEFERLQREEEKCGVGLRCVLCENNLKSVVFLPCGHLIVCEECLTQNLKTEPNVVLERRRKCLYCHSCKLKVKETRLVLFK
jgi:predicted nuclease with TOPRIM domain